ncbi:MAG: PilZ domain-containing protein [Desulfatibacillaceae bacterium]
MANQDRRAHPRIDSLNLLTYSCYDANRDKVGQGMGRTLNVSESGILLETLEPIGEDEVVSLTLALRDEVVTINGTVVRTMPGCEGKFESGLRFQDITPEQVDTLREYIKAFREEYRRRHDRVDSINLIAYKLYDDQGQFISQGMGRTLNVSESGILLETPDPLEKEMIVALTIALKENVLDIQGTVVRFSEGFEGKFESGIEFFELGDENRKLLKEYIEAFRRDFESTGAPM